MLNNSKGYISTISKNSFDRNRICFSEIIDFSSSGNDFGNENIFGQVLIGAGGR